MTTTIKRGRIGEGVARTVALCLLALAAVLLHSREARAQWTTSGTATTTTNNVGIGTASPTTGKLVVGGTAGQTGLDLSSADQYAELRVIRNSLNAGDKDLYLQWLAGVGSKIHFYSNNAETMTMNAGKVGVGTTAPLAPIHVATGTSTGGVAFFQKDAASNGVGIGTTNGAGTISGVNSNYTLSADLLINPYAGNVGIGTTAPVSRLHVAGNITVDGNINAKYQDVAEWVPTTQKLAAGTVVVLDTKHSNHVNASTSAYDTRVAGVVSAQPGIALGEAGEGKALVATTGRVRVKVDATRTPIGIGDLIVTSDVEGVAMKSEPISLGGRQMHAPGTIIGKALEPLEKGTGEILVLLSLQ